MQASSAKEPFDSPDWIFETKLDGYRAIAVIDAASKARIWSRNQLPLEPKFPMVLEAVGRLKLRSTILDAEELDSALSTVAEYLRTGSHRGHRDHPEDPGSRALQPMRG